MLKIKHKLISSLIVAAPLLLNAGAVTTVHASSINNKSCAAYNSVCKSAKSNNCTTINGVQYDCSKLIQSTCSDVNGSVYNCIK
ncbi:hypothetical protein [Clostridium luticellarii]|jgi:hypothetical protein|uniref:DUF1540 domain-containing protein n=1 Tax=Clostridium luticellarii TaxID=1691940 RepID=A0A2T0B6H6_9CLOT|nr:hypothetical protein [Clostridium luticellarii]MCI1945226.1 hypothetical protein [Clostridium luticellarii]MCI1969640.1 hypothetical protein [Clostridium luticellarii]MCI1994559.1 hypothetical protein [Clostridium luticellarii]MCI2038944.1 hypothetical protein [Clostridium luticellarii]PRR79508.1 hypothetical protein CLLU_35020 [Clostridium luticellarii]